MKIPFAFVLLLAAAASAQTPAAWDWRDVDGVDYTTPVENVGSCGATWLFAPVSVVEARLRVAVGQMGIALPDADFSEQQVMDCGTGYYGPFGCGGGYSKDVLTHIRDNGVVMESCYEYVGVEGDCPDDCPDSGANPVLHFPIVAVGELTGFPADADVMQEIYDHGPVATSLNIYQDFFDYSGGVYEHVAGYYSGSSVAMIVGWGDNLGTPYWICRSAWRSGDGPC